jgi:hypothetical protein
MISATRGRSKEGDLNGAQRLNSLNVLNESNIKSYGKL